MDVCAKALGLMWQNVSSSSDGPPGQQVEDPFGCNVPVGTNDIFLNPETNLGWRRKTSGGSTRLQYFLVYAWSREVGESDVPTALKVYDRDATARNLSFSDLDLDPAQIGGSLLWHYPDPPDFSTDPEVVSFYALYLASDARGNLRERLCRTIPLLWAVS